MCRDIAPYVQSFALTIFFRIRKTRFYRPVVQMIFELIGQIGVFCRFMLGSPVKPIIFFPLSFEGITIARLCPELRFLQVNGVNPRVNDPFDHFLLHVFYKILRRHDIVHHATMPECIALLGYLSFIQVPFPIPLSREIVLVFTPGNACHKVCSVPSFAPSLDAFFKTHVAHSMMILYTVDDRHVRPHICHRFPGIGGLKCSFFTPPALLSERSCRRLRTSLEEKKKN